jgi:ubiquinone/menaquinone biosynthesis C-methylase UbiE
MANDAMTTWLNSLPSDSGFPCISTPRRYTFDENAYDQQYQIEPGALASGKGVLNLLAAHECDTQGPLMEIGCGTGHFSLGLASGSPFSYTLLTDPSTAFLNITRKKLQANNIMTDQVRFAVFTGEDLSRVPANMLSCIALRSTLHHVLDIDEFFTSAARALRPGGVLIFQEPFAEGFLLMAAMAQFLPQAVAASGAKLSDAERNKLQEFLDTMTFYLRRDVDKANCEDKHVFRANELITLCQQKGMAAKFYGNVNTEQFAVTPTDLQIVPFGRWFHDYTKYCMSWDESMMRLFRRHLAPACELVEKATGGTSGPHFSGIVVAKKTDG